MLIFNHYYQALDRFWDFCYYVYVDNNHNKYVQFNPEPWQVHYFYNIYEFYYKEQPEKRLRNRFFLTVSRKNTKSTILRVFLVLLRKT
jgi:phage terminase large subunit-like protein